jgi:hypothetical protein
VPRRRDAQTRDPAPARCEDLAFVDEVPGQEDDQEHLGQLAGLEVDRPEPYPQSGAVDLPPQPGREGQEQREEPEEEEGVPVPLEQVDAPYDPKSPDEGADAHHGPHGLARCELILGVAVDSRDDDEPDAVEQRRQRQERAVGPGRERAHGEVREHIQADQHGQEEPEVGGKRGSLGQRDEDVAADRDDDGEEPEPELGVAPLRRGEAHDGGGGAIGGSVDSGGTGTVVVVVLSSMLRRRRAT